MVDLALADDRLRNPADVGRAGFRGDVHRHLQCHVAVEVYRGLYIDVHADIEILKLCIYQRVDAYSADSRLERSGSDGNTRSNLQAGFLSVGSADFRVLQQFRIGVAEQGIQLGLWNTHREIRSVKIPKGIEREAIGARRTRARGVGAGTVRSWRCYGLSWRGELHANRAVGER